MNQESAFPKSFRGWNDDIKEYYQSSTTGLTKVQLLTAIILNGYISANSVAAESTVDNSIRLAEMILKKTEQ